VYILAHRDVSVYSTTSFFLQRGNIIAAERRFSRAFPVFKTGLPTYYDWIEARIRSAARVPWRGLSTKTVRWRNG